MFSLDAKIITIRIYYKLNNFRLVEEFTKISKSTICRWVNSKNNVKIENDKNPNKQNIIKVIKEVLIYNPLFTIKEIQKFLNFEYSYDLIRNIMKNELKMTFKKTKWQQYTNLEKLKEQTNNFCSEFKKKYNSKKIIASIDEVGFSSRMYPLFSWSTKGKKIHNKIKLDTKNMKNTSVCSCITNEGNITYDTNSSSYNKNSFLSFMKKLDLPINTIILIDNVRFHHSKEVKSYAKTKNWDLLYIPPYSPWFNPIENIFSMVKNKYRKCKDIDTSFKIVENKNIINCFTSTIKNIINDKYLL